MRSVQMNKAIDEDFIHEEAARMYRELCRSLTMWKIAFRGLQVTELEATATKTTTGTAQGNGAVEITNAYVGTCFVEALRSTIAHELAHLYVGVACGHNRTFKRAFEMFCHVLGVDQSVAELQRRALVDPIRAKPRFLLIAHCANNLEIEIGEFHRRSKKYTEYDKASVPKRFKNYRIERFEYRAM